MIRDNGNTLKTIIMSAMTNISVCCATQESKDRLLKIAKEMGMKIPEPQLVKKKV